MRMESGFACFFFLAKPLSMRTAQRRSGTDRRSCFFNSEGLLVFEDSVTHAACNYTEHVFATLSGPLPADCGNQTAPGLPKP